MGLQRYGRGMLEGMERRSFSFPQDERKAESELIDDSAGEGGMLSFTFPSLILPLFPPVYHLSS